MSDDDRFWQVAEQVIELANNLCDDTDPGVVSAGLLYAAARFNAFVVASSSVEQAAFAEDINESERYLVDQYQQMLAEHMQDYQQHYQELLADSNKK